MKDARKRVLDTAWDLVCARTGYLFWDRVGYPAQRRVYGRVCGRVWWRVRDDADKR